MKEKETKQVVLVKFRCNPQIGDYCTIRIADVVRTTATTIQVENYGSRISFDLSGCEKKPSRSVYGSSEYRIYDFEAAKELFDGEKFKGYRISQGKEVFTNI